MAPAYEPWNAECAADGGAFAPTALAVRMAYAPASPFVRSPARTGSKSSPTRNTSQRRPFRSPIVSSPDKLFYMANQIGKFFQNQGHDKAVPGIAEHIRKFWDPGMR